MRTHQRLLIIVILSTHSILLFIGTRVHFATIDETGHIPAGLHHWHHGTFELYRVNPPLPRMIAVLPLLFANPDTKFAHPNDAPGRRLEWSANWSFANQNQARYVEFVRLARLTGIGWSLLGAWLVMRWSRELFGPKAGLLALVLWCFGPSILAYAQLVTPDIPCTVSGLLACYVFRRYLHTPSWHDAWFTGLVLGVALLTRITWVIFFGLWPIIAILFLYQHPWSGRRFFQRAGQMVLILSLGLVILNLGYGFQGTGRPLGDYPFVSKALGGERSLSQPFGNRFRGTWLAPIPVPLPEDYVLGMDLQRVDFESNWPFYLNGTWEKGGHWYFYLFAMAVKLPLGIWGLFLLTTALIMSRRVVSDRREELLLWLPAFAILVVVSSQTGLNYFRYILPMFPFVLIAISRSAMLIDRNTWKRGALVLILTLGTLVSSLSVYPHSLAYFNEAAGGVENGYQRLVDSNLDWGQDLLFLKAWLESHPQQTPIGLAYFNFVDPKVVGIEYELPPLGPSTGSTKLNAKHLPQRIGPYPGVYAVSVHLVQGGTFLIADGLGSRRMVPLNGYSYFQHFHPVAKAGKTIWIYHLTLEEVNIMREKMRLPALYQ